MHHETGTQRAPFLLPQKALKFSVEDRHDLRGCKAVLELGGAASGPVSANKRSRDRRVATLFLNSALYVVILDV